MCEGYGEGGGGGGWLLEEVVGTDTNFQLFNLIPHSEDIRHELGKFKNSCSSYQSVTAVCEEYKDTNFL